MGLPDRQDPQPAEQMEEQLAAPGPFTTAADGRGPGTLPEAAETDRDPRYCLSPCACCKDTERIGVKPQCLVCLQRQTDPRRNFSDYQQHVADKAAACCCLSDESTVAAKLPILPESP